MTANTFRPTRFTQLVGQDSTKNILEILVNGFRKNHNPLGHILFLGPPGVGKTTFASVLAAEMGVGFHSYVAAKDTDWADLASVICGANAGDVVFIDEIHALTGDLQQRLYTVLEDFQCQIPVANSRAVQTVAVPRVTIVGATTHQGDILPALLSRFDLKLTLSSYTNEQLQKMVADFLWRTEKLACKCTIEMRLARVSQRNARRACSLMRSMVQVADGLIAGKLQVGDLTDDIFETTIYGQGIDAMIGLDSDSRKYLVVLSKCLSMGRATLAQKLNRPEATLAQHIEPFLMSDDIELDVNLEQPDGTMKRETLVGPLVKLSDTGRPGRCITNSGRAYLKMCIRAQQKLGWFPDERLE